MLFGSVSFWLKGSAAVVGIGSHWNSEDGIIVLSHHLASILCSWAPTHLLKGHTTHMQLSLINLIKEFEFIYQILWFGAILELLHRSRGFQRYNSLNPEVKWDPPPLSLFCCTHSFARKWVPHFNGIWTQFVNLLNCKSTKRWNYFFTFIGVIWKSSKDFGARPATWVVIPGPFVLF